MIHVCSNIYSSSQQSSSEKLTEKFFKKFFVFREGENNFSQREAEKLLEIAQIYCTRAGEENSNKNWK